MKIKKTTNNAGKWFDLPKKVAVATQDGIEQCERFYFNGFEPVIKVTTSDGAEYHFTHNHRLMTKHNSWVRVDGLQIGDILNNDLVITSLETAGVRPTMDMEVPNKHYYILDNGVMSHNTSFICGNTTPGIEPNRSNVFVKALAGIQTVVKNKYLEKLLVEKGKNEQEVWESIIDNLGSVAHLDFLTQDEKNIFKTASEISPKDMIDLAADRQEYIDMAQSLNLFNRPNYTLKDIYDIHMYGLNKGIKTFYYFYPQVHAAYEKEGEKWDTCISCAD